ncbi:MAG: sterol desaturase family protein [Saprospiraceae bacterium]|nr:sterol desaturase family protein [Saprospiraceae bacterium]MCB9323675.1 sterol desaturase family protein [Lewinellaceae bacterium]
MNDIVIYAIPGFILLLLLEVWFSARYQKQWFEAKDTSSSLAMGIGSVIVGLVGKAIVFGAYSLVYHYHIFEIESTWWAWLLLVFGEDLSYYWFHRISHQSRYFWASHVVHHSSRHYNLGTALRQTWTGDLTGGFIFWLWLPLIGFHPVWVMLQQSISLLYQFWIHTEAIDKLPRPIEFLFNTPSHHRVHHASDPKYLDRNHAGIFIIWDRLFGTFQVEEEHPNYGLVKNINTFNPVKIAFMEWGSLITDAIKSGSFRNAIGYVFGPPGWSPDGSRKTSEQLRAEYLKKGKSKM